MSEPKFPLYAMSRLRMETDGEGVTTLVAAHGCPLRCRMCLNPASLTGEASEWLTARELYDRVRIDDLYFRATGGGVTFGGGEPLLHTDFITEFRALCGRDWRLCAETSLNIPPEHIPAAAAAIDHFMVDIKDMDPAIYRAYTGRDNDRVIANLRTLIALVGPDRVTVRVPQIPDHNTARDVSASTQTLRDMGFERFHHFVYKRILEKGETS